GSAAFKVGLASAAAGAGAAAQTARLGELVARRARGGELPSLNDRVLGAAAGLLFGLSYAAAFQAARPEVYALSALLVVSAALVDGLGAGVSEVARARAALRRAGGGVGAGARAAPRRAAAGDRGRVRAGAAAGAAAARAVPRRRRAARRVRAGAGRLRSGES